ncbi:MAG: FHA domain-containing protein [Methylotenera sp.]|nr:FHA domain-containing protein [Oligoflexia bacterium]
MANALKFKHTQVPRQTGEQARLKVVQGPDSGAIYVITANLATIGRGDENDMIISDLKASRKHAQFSSVTSQEWAVKDLGSANGLLHNGKVTRQCTIKSGDTVAFGETTLEFLLQEATQLLMAPAKSMTQIQADQKAFEAQKKKATNFSKGSDPAAQKRSNAAGGLFKNKLMLGVIGVGAYLMFFVDSDPAPNKKVAKDSAKESRNLASYLPAINPDDTQSGRAAETFFRVGFREYREKNYLRAKTQFETVLQVVPGHPLATLYLENCDKAIEDEVKSHLEMGKKGLSSGKLRSAQGHFQSVKRLLNRDQSNPAYLEAKDQLDAVEKELRGGYSG